MKFNTTHHCHTTFSDGKNVPAEMVLKAQNIGFKEIGISDHLVLHPTIDNVSWAMPLSKLDLYYNAILQLKESSSIKVKIGLEVDFFPDTLTIGKIENILTKYKFDYLIGSVHFINDFSIDGNKKYWKHLSQSEINKIYLSYWKNIKLLAKSKLFNIVGHIDLPKKFGYLETIDLRNEILDALNEIKKNNLKIEINTAGYSKICKDVYPSSTILKECQNLEIPIIVNDDSHSIHQLGQYYDKLEVEVKKSNLILNFNNKFK